MLAIRADLLDFTATPAWQGADLDGVRFRPDHWLLVEAGRIVGAQPAGLPLEGDWARHDHAGRLILPGFIDTHVHCPQLDVIASYGAGLLVWLGAVRLLTPDLVMEASYFTKALLAAVRKILKLHPVGK